MKNGCIAAEKQYRKFLSWFLERKECKRYTSLQEIADTCFLGRALSDIDEERGLPNIGEYCLERTLQDYDKDFNGIIQAIEQPNVQDILDLGCGLGYAAVQIANAWPEKNVHGYTLMKILPKGSEPDAYKKVQWIYDKAQNIMKHFKPESLDLITCRCMFYAVENKIQLLDNLSKILRPGGTFHVDIGLNFAGIENLIIDVNGKNTPFSERLKKHTLQGLSVHKGKIIHYLKHERGEKPLELSKHYRLEKREDTQETYIPF